MANNEAEVALKKVSGLLVSMSAEQEKSKRILLSAEAAASGLGFFTKTGDKFDFDVFFKFLSTSRKSMEEKGKKIKLLTTGLSTKTLLLEEVHDFCTDMQKLIDTSRKIWTRLKLCGSLVDQSSAMTSLLK